MVIKVLPSEGFRLPHPWSVVYIRLRRGDPDYTPYNGLPQHLRREWDALEGFVVRMSRGRHLYVVGAFEHVPENVQQFVWKRCKGYWAGTCKVAAPGDLHELLAENPLEWYYYVVTEAGVAARIAGRFMDVPRWEHFFEHVIADCEGIVCLIEENKNRDSLALGCRDHALPAVMSDLKSVCGKFALGVSEKLSDRRVDSSV